MMYQYTSNWVVQKEAGPDVQDDQVTCSLRRLSLLTKNLTPVLASIIFVQYVLPTTLEQKLVAFCCLYF